MKSARKYNLYNILIVPIMFLATLGLIGLYEIVIDTNYLLITKYTTIFGVIFGIIFTTIYIKHNRRNKKNTGDYLIKAIEVIIPFIGFAFVCGGIFYQGSMIINNVFANDNTIIQGEIYQKEINTPKGGRINFEGRTYHYIFIKENGKKIKLSVSQNNYYNYQIGDFYEKDDWKTGLLGITYRTKWSDQTKIKKLLKNIIK